MKLKHFILFTFLLLLLNGMFPVSGVEGDFKINILTVEQMSQPLGIDVVKPDFSWKLESKTNGEEQGAWQIIVSSVQNEKKTVWDSGKVKSNQQTFVAYRGPALAPKTMYQVELFVWNGDDTKMAKSSTAFSTGIYPTKVDPKPWKGKWIGYQADAKKEAVLPLKKAAWINYASDASVPPGKAVYRFTFEVSDPAKIARAEAAFTGDNSFRFFVNGDMYVTGSGYNTALRKNILPLLKKGKNVFAAEIDNAGDSNNPAGLIGVISLEGKDGKVTNYLTDTSWKCINKTDPAFFDADFNDTNWGKAFKVADCDAKPWGEINISSVDGTILPARYLSKAVNLQKKDIVRATVYLVGLGYYELFLNGERVGDHRLDPILTEFKKRVAYNTYDITKMLRECRDNEFTNISVVLGNGRYFPPRQSGKLNLEAYGFPKLLFQMEIEYADGSKQVVVSDESWNVSDGGPIRANNDYDGEIFDARLAEPAKGIVRNSYMEKALNGVVYTVKTNEKAQLTIAPKGKIEAQMMEPMRKSMEITPKTITEIRPGVFIYDFGQNFVGYTRLKVKGSSGTTVKMRFAETLQTEGPEKGMLYVANLRAAKCQDQYILNGAANGEVYEPRFSYHGFRFAELIGYPGKPNLKTLTGCVVSTDVKLVGQFECSNPTITQFVKNVEWGTRGNYLSMPTDCPQRDERQGWQGDRAEESKGEMFLFNNITLYRKWMQDIEDTQRPDGNVSDVAPAYWELYGTNVTWPTAQTLVPESLYLMYGDKKTIVNHYDSRKKWLAHLTTFVKSDGTIDKDNYGDWCVPPESQELIHSKDPARRTDKGLLATSYMIHNLNLAEKYANMIGKKDDAKAFRAQADKMTIDFNKVFYRPQEGKYDNGTQTSSILPLAFGIVPKGEKEKVFQTLVNNIEKTTKGHIGTGLIGGQWINRVLTENGRGDLAWGFATETTYPSWGYMLSKGATTVWELWNGDTADPAMNSGNHVMLVGDLIIWLFEDLAGIKADEKEPGFKQVIMRPRLIGNLSSVRASYDSVRGRIGSDWKIDSNKNFIWTIQIPVNSTALVSIPTSDANSIICKDIDMKLVKKNLVDGRTEFTVGSGIYHFTAPLK